VPAELDDLLGLQRRFLAALGEPVFGDSRERTDLPPRAGEVSAAFAATAADLLTPSPTLAPVERLELYHRQYWYRLLDSIADDFPALRAILGADAFGRLVEAYLEAHPPRSFTLLRLGAGLADFVCTGAVDLAWPVHAEDMARLEYALCAAFEAGDAAPVPASELATARLRLPPHVHLLACRTPVDTLWRRVDDGASPGRLGAPSAKPSRFVAVYRDDLVLRIERLPRAAHVMLTAIAETGSLDAAMDRVAAAKVLPRQGGEQKVSAWFATWIARGWLCAA
jgi:hypothetical protein